MIKKEGYFMFKKIVIILVIVSLFSIILITASKASYRKYKDLINEGRERIEQLDTKIITNEDIEHLPSPVQKYLQYVGVIGKDRITKISLNIDGKMKMDLDKDWAPVTVEQVSFFDKVTRLFYIKMNMKGLPISGLHYYKEGIANMTIKILGLVKVVDGKGEEMNIGETVTVFNDMCILAPSTLIDPQITWESIDDLTAKGYFTSNGITISATLFFNEKGQLINFVSEDRYFSPTGKTFERVTWSTPVSNYKNINGYNLSTYGEATWKFEDKDFTYAKFKFNNIVYN